MYRNNTKLFRILGAIIIFLQIPKVLALFTISENTKSHCSSSSLSLTARPARQWPKEDARRRCLLRSAKRVGGEAPVKQTAPTWPTLFPEPILAFRKAKGAPEIAPHWAWRLGHNGVRRNHGDVIVETKAKWSSRSGAHRDHVGRLGEGGDVLDRRDHGEVDDGGAPAGSEEDDVARWRWPARGEASRSGMSGRARRSFWPTQLTPGTTTRTNFASAVRTPAASSRRETEERRWRAPIYRKKEGVRCRQHTSELTTEASACHRVWKRRRRSAANSGVSPVASREVYFDFWNIYRTATESIFQITLKFSKEVENLQKWKLFNFSSTTTLV